MKNKETWVCTRDCGACCRLAPEERSEAIAVLGEEDLDTYMGMVGSDGWCIYFDTGTRSCKIYDQRPEFCKVKSLKKFFKIGDIDPDVYAIECCKQQIRSLYGGRSREMHRFRRSIRLKSKRNHD